MNIILKLNETEFEYLLQSYYDAAREIFDTRDEIEYVKFWGVFDKLVSKAEKVHGRKIPPVTFLLSEKKETN